jgi:hypothetical protein
VYLCDARDRFGVQKLGTPWKYTAENAAAIRKSQNVLKEELANAGLGNFEISSEPDGTPTTINAHANHYFGMTRMSKRPEDGVVDTECRAHGIANLYIASSSVFPTGGFANPTLTIIALAKRVADNMRSAWLQALPEAKEGLGILIVDRGNSADALAFCICFVAGSAAGVSLGCTVEQSLRFCSSSCWKEGFGPSTPGIDLVRSRRDLDHDRMIADRQL